MVSSNDSSITLSLSLLDELILMLLNEESGYFHQVPGWNLNCAIIGAALAELSLLHRIDTDLESLFLVDGTETGDSILDPILAEIADEPLQRSAQYWIERLTPRAEAIIDATLNRLVNDGVLVHHDGDFWTLSPTAWRTGLLGTSSIAPTGHFVKSRISDFVFNSVIPEPRDIIIICLINTCDVFRFMFELDEEAEARINFICNMDLIGRSMAAAIAGSIVAPLLSRPSLTREIPTVPLRRILLNPHLREGNLPALFADLTQEYGPVFQLHPPFAQPMTFLAGPEVNRWVHRNGRIYLRAKDYFTDMEKAYGASGLIPGLDGADHFRIRKAMQPGYSRARLEGVLPELYNNARLFMADWNVGDIVSAAATCRLLTNAQLSRMFVGIDSQDIIHDLIKFKERALTTHVARLLPKFLLNTPPMKRRARIVDEVLNRIQRGHTPAQRLGRPRDFADDMMSLHSNDPQFMPESNLGFMLSAPLLASMYLGDMLGFALYAMGSQPEYYEKIRREADALFNNGDPDADDFTLSAIDITHRFIMECMRLYPVVPASIRNVMNTCVVEGYELPLGTRVHIASTAPHYMDDVFPEPLSFDIDRYLPPRNEHISPGYAPTGLGTHMCLGSRWMELHLAVNLLMIAHYFTIEMHPRQYKLRINPFPSMTLSTKAKFRITEQRRPLPA